MSDEELATKAPESDATVEQSRFHSNSREHEGPTMGVSNEMPLENNQAHGSQEHCVTDRPTRKL